MKTTARAAGALTMMLMLSAAHAELHELVDASLQAFDAGQASFWSYERASGNAEERIVEQFDAGAATDQRWSLVEVNGASPASGRLGDYLAGAPSRADREHPAAFDPRDLMESSSLELKEDTGSELHFQFQPRADDDASEDEAEILEKLRGTLVVNKTPARLVSIELNNTEDFSPAAMVRIKTLRTRFEFAPMHAGGPTALTVVETEVDGRFMRFKKFQELERVEFRAFEKVGGGGPPAAGIP